MPTINNEAIERLLEAARRARDLRISEQEHYDAVEDLFRIAYEVLLKDTAPPSADAARVELPIHVNDSGTIECQCIHPSGGSMIDLLEHERATCGDLACHVIADIPVAVAVVEGKVEEDSDD